VIHESTNPKQDSTTDDQRIFGSWFGFDLDGHFGFASPSSLTVISNPDLFDAAKTESIILYCTVLYCTVMTNRIDVARPSNAGLKLNRLRYIKPEAGLTAHAKEAMVHNTGPVQRWFQISQNDAYYAYESVVQGSRFGYDFNGAVQLVKWYN
jgi:hypothetical protein